MKRYLQAGAVTILLVFLCIRGIAPALTSVNTDFPNYYTAARLLVEGKSMERLYDDAWFQDQIHLYGMDQQGKFSPYPPVTALVMTPFVNMAPLDALRTWTVLNIGLLAAGVVLLSRITNKPFLWSSLLFLLSGHALANNFKFGQFYLILTLLLMIGYRSWINKEQIVAGTVFGIGSAIKYFPIVFVPLFIVRREWRLVAAGIFATALLVLAGVGWMGVKVNEQFVSGILGNHLTGDIQNPFSPTFQSWNSFFRRIFIYDQVLNPRPFVRSSSLYAVALLATYSTVIAALAITFRKLSHARPKNDQTKQFALLCVAGLLLLPASATYHFLLLVLPTALILNSDKWSIEQKCIALLFAVIGFIPYSYFEGFQNMGVLTILAYPRLLLMTGIFALFVSQILRVDDGPHHHPFPEAIQPYDHTS